MKTTGPWSIRSPGRSLVAIGCLALCLVARIGLTQTGVGDGVSSEMIDASPERAAIVMLGIRGQEEELQPLVRAVGAQLSDLPTELLVIWQDDFPGGLPDRIELASRIAAEHGARAVFWFELGAGGKVFFHVAGADPDRLLVRGLQMPAEGPDAFEAFGIVVRAAVEALTAGGEIGISGPAEAPTSRAVTPPGPTVEKATVESEQPREDATKDFGPTPTGSEEGVHRAVDAVPVDKNAAGSLDLALGYSLEGYSEQVPLVHGLEMGLRYRELQGVSAGLRFTALWPIRILGETADVDLRRFPAALSIGYRFAKGRWSLGLEAAGRFEMVVQETSRVNPASGLAAADHTNLTIGVGPSALAGVRLASRLSLILGFDGIVVINRVSYRVSLEQGYERVLRPRRFQPTGTLCLSVDLL